MGIDDIIANEPMYAGHYEAARERRAHQNRLQERTANGTRRVAEPDGGVAVEEGADTSLSFGSAELHLSSTETLILGVLLVNTAMTAGLLFAVLMQ